MDFDQIGQTATITFDMDTLEAMARACRFADESGVSGQHKDAYPYDVMACAFTAAAMIARTHGDIPNEAAEHMARVHKYITQG